MRPEPQGQGVDKAQILLAVRNESAAELSIDETPLRSRDGFASHPIPDLLLARKALEPSVFEDPHVHLHSDSLSFSVFYHKVEGITDAKILALLSAAAG